MNKYILIAYIKLVEVFINKKKKIIILNVLEFVFIIVFKSNKY